MKPKTNQLPNVPGVYSLLINTIKPFRIKVKSGKIFDIPSGVMIYTGSAQGRGAANLANRITRHFRTLTTKTPFWHIDFLLAKTGPPDLCYYAETTHRMECTIVQTLLSYGGRLIPGFGASDCKARCGSHLLYFRQVQQALYSLVHTYRTHDLAPHMLSPKARNLSNAQFVSGNR